MYGCAFTCCGHVHARSERRSGVAAFSLRPSRGFVPVRFPETRRTLLMNGFRWKNRHHRMSRGQTVRRTQLQLITSLQLLPVSGCDASVRDGVWRHILDDPLSSLPPPGPTARLPAFSETEEPEKKKRKTRGDHFKQRFRKNFTTLLEEENLSERPEPNYLSAAAPPSTLPPRHFCCVCGFPSHYTCTTCGGRYCSSKCLCTHRETRCLKWTL
ncbi:zinc finger HIT domain-containing protein 1 isoform X2 [Gasterosteus aculeatus]